MNSNRCFIPGIRIFLILIFTSAFVKSQTLKISVGGIYQFHLGGITNKEPHIQNQLITSEQSPAISDFFSNNVGWNFSLGFRIPLAENGDGIILGFEYESIELSNENHNINSTRILGKTLDIKTYAPFIGYGWFFNDGKIFLHNSFGLSLKDYGGKSNFGLYEVKHNYKNGIFFKIISGIDFERLGDSPLTIGVGVKMEFGSISRRDVEYTLNGEKVGRLIPIGDKQLQDIQLSPFISISYQLNFS
ncbi:MAG: hypothetical protein HND52_17745 [Ignavibacteriae bacterium]|nr:hypothetical protein [Ignavibacteriota bacterium]NOG99807.1 hypothetical protein [Ignavibacteriota bacterium]